MNRLQPELDRLYAAQTAAGPDASGDPAGPVDASGRVRALVLELARPADWAALSTVWKGVQVDLDLPAPAIAVSGTDGYQLWFSLAEPVPAARALAFLTSLRCRYLGEVKPGRITLWPTTDPAPSPQAPTAARLPPLQVATGQWSAFVAQDLAAVFADEPWLDLPPNPDGQWKLLCGLKSMPLADFELAVERLRAAAPVPPAPASAPEASAVTATVRPGPGPSAPAGPSLAPQQFLLDVMNDGAVSLALRIEAAKALLPYIDVSRQP